MPGPTTEILNDDVRLLRDEIHRADLYVHEVGTQVKIIMSTVKVLGVFTLASLLSGVWWGASLTVKVDGLGMRIDKLEARGDKLEAKVDGLGSRIDKLETRIDKLEAKVDARFDKIDAQFKEVDARFDRLEVSIAKLIEQTKPAPPATKP